MNISCAMTDAILLYYNIKFEISQYDFHEFYTKKTGEKPPENKKTKNKNYFNVSSMEKSQSTRHKMPFGMSEAEQIEGFLGRNE